MSGDTPRCLELAAEVVAAFVSNNAVRGAELPSLIGSVHATLRKLASTDPASLPEPPTPAVPIDRSVFPDFIVSLEDGTRYKSMKRHLRAKYDMTPDQYRAKWGLPADYPIVAPNYAKLRSKLARKIGLGQRRKARRAKRRVAKHARRGSAPRALTDSERTHARAVYSSNWMLCGRCYKRRKTGRHRWFPKLIFLWSMMSPTTATS